MSSDVSPAPQRKLSEDYLDNSLDSALTTDSTIKGLNADLTRPAETGAKPESISMLTTELATKAPTNNSTKPISDTIIDKSDSNANTIQTRPFMDSVWMATKQAYREARRSKAQYCIGSASVFIVVVIVTILISSISYSPAIFLSLAEASSGEIDLDLTPTHDKINYTAASIVLNQKQIPRHTARLAGIDATVYPARQCVGFNQSAPEESLFTYVGYPSAPQYLKTMCQDGGGGGCLFALCPVTPADGKLYFIQSLRERNLGIGRSWPFPPIPAGSAYVHQSLASLIGIQPGDYIYVNLNLLDLLPVTYNLAASKPQEDETSLNLPLLVRQIIIGNYGKLSKDETSAIFVEYETAVELVANNLPPVYNDTFRQSMRSLASTIDQQASSLLITCADDRISCYLNSDYPSVARQLVDWASSVVYSLGWSDLQSNLPILRNLASSRMLSAFLNLVFSIIIVVLSALSVFLIYSLLMVSVETRVFEMGIFRMIGLPRKGVLSLILVQALSYAIPGWSLGLLAGQAVWILVRQLLAGVLNSQLSMYISPGSILLATFLGLLIPLMASILPIRRALTGNLHDALDTRRSKTKAVLITVERTKASWFSKRLIFPGAFLTLFGFSIYYFLPLALVTSNISLLFNIFIILLLGMLFGLVMLSLNAQPLMERLLVRLYFAATGGWLENKSIGLLVVKNLGAHRLRNRKTSIMYAMALGFIIFLTVAIRNELISIRYLTEQKYGTPIVFSTSIYRLTGNQPYSVPFELLTRYCRQSPLIAGFTYSSFDIATINSGITSVSVTNLGGVASASVKLLAVAPNFFKVLPAEFLQANSWPVSTVSADPTAITEYLYSRSGNNSIILGTALRKTLNLHSFDNSLLLKIQMESSETGTTNSSRFLMYPAAFMNSAPVLKFSAFPSAAGKQDTVVSIPILLALLKGIGSPFNSVRQIPIEKFYIKCVPGISSAQLQSIGNDLAQLRLPGTITLVQNELASIEQASDTLSLLFQIVTVVVLIIAFFSLNSSMFTNIMEQKMEIGILRALGVRKLAIFRLYTYEAFFLIFAASLLGVIIGIIMGWSMAAQRSLMTQVPLDFRFPVDIFLTTLIVALICAILTSIGPTVHLLRGKRVIALIRG